MLRRSVYHLFAVMSARPEVYVIHPPVTQNNLSAGLRVKPKSQAHTTPGASEMVCT